MNVKELIDKLSKYDSSLEVRMVELHGIDFEIEDMAIYEGMNEEDKELIRAVFLLSLKGEGPTNYMFPMHRVDEDVVEALKNLTELVDKSIKSSGFEEVTWEFPQNNESVVEFHIYNVKEHEEMQGES